MAATCSEGAKPRRTVRIHDPNDRQITCGTVGASICGRQYLKQSLRNDSELNMEVIGTHFPPNVIPVGFGFLV